MNLTHLKIIFCILKITHPELNAKIEVMIALAPAASVANVKSLVRLSAAFVNPIEVFLFVTFKKKQSNL